MVGEKGYFERDLACQPVHTKKVTSSIGILAQLSKHWVFHYAAHIISLDFYLY